MLLQFSKNVHFTRLVKINSRLKEFNLRRIPDATDFLFHADVADDRGNRIVFKLKKTNNDWKIIDKQLPAWILENEKIISDIIIEEGF